MRLTSSIVLSIIVASMGSVIASASEAQDNNKRDTSSLKSIGQQNLIAAGASTSAAGSSVANSASAASTHKSVSASSTVKSSSTASAATSIAASSSSSPSSSANATGEDGEPITSESSFATRNAPIFDGMKVFLGWVGLGIFGFVLVV